MAKRKAASRLGARQTDSLPTNAEIESELRAYQALYLDDDHVEHLQQLRHTALDLMDFFEEFKPCLHGSVADGTAGRYSPIDLALFSDSSKDVEIWLLSRSIPYQVEPIRGRRPQDPEARLALDWEDVSVQLSVYQLRQKRNGHQPQSVSRATLGALING
jgi:predicted nucleotidyltransferase